MLIWVIKYDSVLDLLGHFYSGENAQKSTGDYNKEAQERGVPVPEESWGWEDIGQGWAAFLNAVMALQEQIQDKGWTLEYILLVSPMLINGNVTMSYILNRWCESVMWIGDWIGDVNWWHFWRYFVFIVRKPV